MLFPARKGTPSWVAKCASFKDQHVSASGGRVHSRVALRQLSVFLSLLVASVTAWAGGPVIPDWVHAAVAEPVPVLPETTKAVVLLDEETYTVAPDGRATIHVRNVMRILRPQGRREAEPTVYFGKDSKVVSMHVWSIDPAGHEYAMKDNEIRDVGPYGGVALYSDERAMFAEPPGRDPGGIVAYEYEKRERPYLAETNWSFQDEMPHVSQSFTLVLPPTFSYTTTWAHHPPVEGSDLENHRYRWQMDHEPAIDVERVPLSPAADSLMGRMTVHYSGPGLHFPQEGTWQGIGEWYEVLARDRLRTSPEIATKATELANGKADFYDKAEAIGEFVQGHIRYVAINIGVGGWQPHAAQEVFHEGYGDCKDKATLLSAMLSSVGIHSALLMVDTERGVIDPSAPSIYGNHMIGAIEIPQGYESKKMRSVVTANNGKRYLIFDPTWERTPFGQLENNLQGSYGVLMEGPASQIIQLPVLSPDLNRVQRSGSFALSADGTLKGNVMEKRFGDLAEDRREVFTLGDAKQQQRYLDHSVESDFTSASLTDVKVENAHALNQDLTVEYKLEASRFASTVGPLLMVRPRVLGSENLGVDRKTRKVDVNLGETLEARDEFDIELPDGYVVDELPAPVKAEVSFATYQSSTTLQGHTLHYSRTYTQRAVTLPAAKYPELQHLVGIIAADEQNRAILKRSTP